MINDKNIKSNILVEGTTTSRLDLTQLQAQIQNMQMGIDIFKEAINVLKKPPTSPRQFSKNRGMAVIYYGLRESDSEVHVRGGPCCTQ